MILNRKIDWEKLAEIHELKEYFEENFDEFKTEIETYILKFAHFPDETLTKFSKLRALEVTNGITQWAFRRGDENALSVEQNRICMNTVMGFMKNVEMEFPSEGKIDFNDTEKAFVRANRKLYQDAFKNNVEGADRDFYASSTAQFIVCGHKRLEQAMALVEKDYEEMFSPYYIKRGQRYIQSYLDGFEEFKP
ncbi:MAG: hypothetical protein WBB82_07935 [Limnothrix sp.]